MPKREMQSLAVIVTRDKTVVISQEDTGGVVDEVSLAPEQVPILRRWLEEAHEEITDEQE